MLPQGYASLEHDLLSFFGGGGGLVGCIQHTLRMQSAVFRQLGLQIEKVSIKNWKMVDYT